MQEFPCTSSSKISFFKTVNNNSYAMGYKKCVTALIGAMRRHYSQVNEPAESLSRELSSVKKYKIGNCSELSDATVLAMDMNGYENVSKLYLYAKNTKTNQWRSLDHCVTGLNFKVNEQNFAATPTKDSIIIDAWLGKTDSVSGAIETYKANQATELLPNEKIFFVEIEKNNLNQKSLEKYAKKYPHLLLEKNKGKYNTIENEQPANDAMPQRFVNEIKKLYGYKVKKKDIVSEEIQTNTCKIKRGKIKAPTLYNIFMDLFS
jgi:hypothetical protein